MPSKYFDIAIDVGILTLASLWAYAIVRYHKKNYRGKSEQKADANEVILKADAQGIRISDVDYAVGINRYFVKGNHEQVPDFTNIGLKDGDSICVFADNRTISVLKTPKGFVQRELINRALPEKNLPERRIFRIENMSVKDLRDIGIKDGDIVISFNPGLPELYYVWMTVGPVEISKEMFETKREAILKEFEQK